MPVIIHRGVEDNEAIVEENNVGVIISEFSPEHFEEKSKDFLKKKLNDETKKKCEDLAEKKFSMEKAVATYL